jgi:hypothetical protein
MAGRSRYGSTARRALAAVYWQDALPASSNSRATAARGVTTYRGFVHVRARSSAADTRHQTDEHEWRLSGAGTDVGLCRAG